MSRRPLRLTVAILSLLAVPASGLGPLAAQDAASVSVPAGWLVDEAVLRDFDGDGRTDLIVASGHPESEKRVLGVYLSRDSGYAAEPDHALELTPDVVGFAVADLHPDDGQELVLFAPEAVFLWRHRPHERERFSKLFDHSFLWQFSYPGRLVPWQYGVRDLNGDGLDDLFLPSDRGYAAAVQRRQSGRVDFILSELVPPRLDRDDLFGRAAARVEPARRGGGFEIGISIGDEDTGPLLSVSDFVPNPKLRDWDGDGDLDLLNLDREHLNVWLQESGGRFPEEPAVRLTSPVVFDESRRFDVSFAVKTADLDGNERADCVMIVGDQRSDSLRTQVLIYLQSSEKESLFGKSGRPDQLLVISGIVGQARLEDIDGDGRPDLTLNAYRLDVIDAVRSATTERLDVELYVYLNRGGLFSRQPDLAEKFSLPIRTEDVTRFRNLVRFVPDQTGDRVRDLIVNEDLQKIRLLPLVRKRSGLALVRKAIWSIPTSGSVWIQGLERDEDRDVTFVEERRVVHLRLGGGR